MSTLNTIRQKLASLSEKTVQRAKPAVRISWTVLMTLSMLMTSVGVGPSQAAPVANIVGQGFTVTPSDLAFILLQIKIAERHSNALLTNTPPNPNPTGDPVYCQSMVGTGVDQIANPMLSFGLRTVDGSCNNLQPGQETYGAADQTFRRLSTPVFDPAEITAPGFGPPNPTSYAQTSGLVFDSDPRIISNLIVDQTSTNPAAVQAAGFPLRSQGGNVVEPCTTEPTTPGGHNGLPLGCVPQYQTLFIENVTTDVGLSPPFNGLFTIFGQFFDHGLDKINNGGNGAVVVPLKADDPLIAGDDHIFGTPDDLPANARFMIVTRGGIVTGADGFRNALNSDSPFVDQSQTYTSHASHQIFLREYVNNTNIVPVSTGKFLSSADGGLATWAMIKNQAAEVLGLQLGDANVGNIPMILSDPYGNFIPGPVRGLPQYVTASGLVEGDTTAAVLVPADAFFINTAFMNDIAHSAAPTAGGPDDDLTAGGSLDTPVPAGTYDNELLDLHFICGDGRCNENIALSAIHQVFHSEHDRLIDYVKNVLVTDTSGITNLADWQDAFGADGWNGERLFQAARFVTEMEYQHLVFEEFARKVQPGINPFEPFAFNQTDVNPAITAEFAHAVYRFGHSMLTEDIARINADGSHNDIPLFDGFLNPAEYYNGGTAGVLTSQEAAGSIFMGMSDQAGNEIDEFVTDVLRNHLVGLPLDLAAINMTRARSEGIPSLNNFRKQVFAVTNDGQLTPYTDWIDFGQALKHPESLVNFIAAYGMHPIILAETTLAGKRTAADRIVNGTILPGPDGIVGDNPLTICVDINDPIGCDESADDIFPPTDSAEFVFSTGAWANVGSTSITGVDDIDMWVGGLAEHTNLFGGLLGSTFNYVFENQLTNLQNGDRFYYLARTPGMNLRAQLEGNSFAELVMRNTNAHTLKADPFATADCKFELGRITFPAPSGSFITGAGSVADDLLSDCNENRVLLNSPTWDVRYRLINSVDPSGINGQAVYNGRPGIFNDRIFGGNDSDTFWGGEGNDIIEGGDGADVALGGEGNDIITDLAGDDVPKGGPGNDAIDGGPGLDIIMGGDGHDFMNGGANTNEIFAGEGNDFAIAGQGLDAVFGGSGDDWIEGGDMPDLLIGDSSTLFFDDHDLPGHDVFMGQGGDDDYDAEGGDDILVAGPGVEKNAGAAGYDWSIGLADPQPQDADLDLGIVNVLPLNGVRDRFNEVEALSGWNFNDFLRGDSIIPSQIGGGGFIGCDALDQAGLDRIAGLDALVPTLATPIAQVNTNTVTLFCLLTGPFVWGEGNILLGGGGSDVLEGRGADDILDGDKYMNVRLSVRNGVGAEIGSTDLMENAAVSGNFGPGTTGKTLQQAVFAGLVDPGNIVIVREILNGGQLGNVDTAEFSSPQSEYVITRNGNGSVTVSHLGGLGADGTNTLWNMELLSFCAVPGAAAGTCDLRAAPVSIAPVVLAPLAVVSPASLTFAGQPVNTGSAAQVVTLTNTGTGPLTISSIVVSGDFARTTTCVATLIAGANCSISVTFIPTTAGARSGAITITDNSGNVAGSVQSVALSGIGLAPIASLSLASLTFDAQFTGTTSAALPVTLSNTGTAPLNLSSIIASAEFAQTSDCGISLAAGLSCTINVTFTPAATGARTGLLTVNHNAAPVATSTSITLSGTGIAPFISLTPASLTFAARNIGSVSAIQTMQLRNIGAVAVTTTSVTVGGPNANQFVVTFPAASCIRTRNAGLAFCAISVRFAPTAASGAGVKTATVTVVSSGGTIVANISGTAVPVPTIGALPTTLNLGRHALGSTTTTTLTVTNTGTADLHISALNLAGSAAYTAALGTCANPVVAGGTCQILVTFKPTVAGAPITGTLTIVSDASNNPRIVNLTGRAP